jgi:hypothetical protein
MPYLFGGDEVSLPTALRAFVPAQVVREFAARPEAEQESEKLSHFEYYRLCLFAHYLTVATPVPTDVDNQIRLKLWPRGLALESALAMARLILESRTWDFSAVTTRTAWGAKGTPSEREMLCGHHGEWFTVAVGAYAALGHYRSSEAAQVRKGLFEALLAEIDRHSEVFGSLWRAEDGLGCLRAAAAIAHNFGDFDRVVDMWELAVDDPLRLDYYKLSTTPLDSRGKLRYLGRLWTAGELYKSVIDGSSMALENHRHFALRKPRSLRRHYELLLPMGPFFDDWGTRCARLLSGGAIGDAGALDEVLEALVQGWLRLPKTVGYGRALRGMAAQGGELQRRIESHPDLNGHFHRQVIALPRDRFERRWNEQALTLLDEIPSRA